MKPAVSRYRGCHKGSVTMSIDRRKFLKSGLLATTGALASPYIISSPVRAAGTIDVGVLFSLTGGLSIIEKSLHDATLMAISEINASGGAKGMKVNAIVEDGASDPKTYNEKASKLVIQDRVPTVFGSYTSASRKAVLPVFEKRNNLYFYPTYYEGFECSKNVVYTGAVPNQQLSNFIPWIIKTLGKKKFFIVGSNYIYPREMAKVCKILIEKNGGEWIADEYLELAKTYPSEKQALLAQMAVGRIYLKRLNRPADALRLYEAAQASSIPHTDWQATIDRGIAEAKKAMQPQASPVSPVS